MEKKFHEILKEARLNAGLTQSQLAEKIGVAKFTYCNWEQGTREPNVLKLKAIAKALGQIYFDSTVSELHKIKNAPERLPRGFILHRINPLMLVINQRLR